jgi:tetratricopeptide (TPR) repeat protein/predicted Ser/Thr protein kinase
MADPNRCKKCAAELPAEAPEGLCPRCTTQRAFGKPAHTSTEVTADGTNAITDRTAQLPGATQSFDGESPARDWPRGTTVRYFGDYEVQKELGRGGMGVVYRARQVSLNRPVALKMIKAGVLADDAELRRFQNEAEAVALLDHVGIVPVYEVGEHDGQRYFSMKLIEGNNLSEQLGQFQDDPRAAAIVLAETAAAVHHAHMRGILHRDLKPANILLDAEGHPHVTDFGLAKRVDGDAEMTQSGAIMGTPAYMSPEQATGRRGSITTATDVYGLGAILYALLTGKAPFGGDSVWETLDAVRTISPEPPTTSHPGVPRDLETICLKCLEKDPRRRYASAHEVSSDLNAWLDSRPISARRVGTAERAWLWCKRKPAVAALAAGVLLAIVAGTGAVIAVQAMANTRLHTANSALDTERERAEYGENQAIEAVKSFRDAVANEPALKSNPTLGDLRKRLLKEPLLFFKTLRNRLQATQDTRPESVARLAEASFDLGKLTNEIGDKEDALSAFRESRASFQRLADANPTNTAFQSDLATNLDHLGNLLGETGKRTEAMSILESSLLIRQKLVAAEPRTTGFQRKLAATHHTLGNLLHATGKSTEAIEAFERSLAILRKLAEAQPADTEVQSAIGTGHNNIGIMLHVTGKPADAIKAHELALAIRQKLAAAEPTVTEFQSNVAASHNNIALNLSEIGKPDEAMRAHEAAQAIRQKLADENPTVTAFQTSLAQGHNNLGSMFWTTKQFDKALKAFEAAIPIYQELVKANPTVLDFVRQLAGCDYNIGVMLRDGGKPAEALQAFDRALKVQQRLAREHPESPNFASDLGANLNNTAMIDMQARRFEQARARLNQAVEWQRKALASNPVHPVYRQYMENHLGNLVETAQGLGESDRLAEAKKNLTEFLDSAPATVALDARLAAIVRGDQKPNDETERLQLAQRAYEKALHVTAVRLWSEAFATNPKLGDDRQAGYRYNAACAASLAAAGRGKDIPAPDETARVRLRRLAFDWLKADFSSKTRGATNIEQNQKPTVAETLAHWLEDADLAGVRNDLELAKLPEAERTEWRSLWTNVAGFVKQTNLRSP